MTSNLKYESLVIRKIFYWKNNQNSLVMEKQF